MTGIAEAEAKRVHSPAAQIERVVFAATIWLASGVIAPGVVLGPLLAAGRRPSALPLLAELAFWAGSGIAALGLGLLIWAACPVLGDSLLSADHHKLQTVRIGIPLNVGGMAVALMALLLSSS